MTCTATVSPEQSGGGVDANAGVSLLSPTRGNVEHTDRSEWEANGAEPEPELAGSLHAHPLKGSEFSLNVERFLAGFGSLCKKTHKHAAETYEYTQIRVFL